MRPLLTLLLISAASVPLLSQNVILGVLEEDRGHYAGDPNYRSVRVIFEKRGNEWQPFPTDCDDSACLKKLSADYPEEVSWTVTFDGKNIGHVASHMPDGYRWYGDVGQQQIISSDPLPVVGTRSREFGGYPDALAYRPLITNSQPFFADPERWKPSTLSADLVTALRHAFRAEHPKLCRSSKTDESKLETYPYKDEEVRLVKSYSSTFGLTVARLHLEAIDCGDAEAGFDIDDPWFAVDTMRSITYLDSGIWLVDAGDYDDDGRSELVFSINRDNEGGYEIYYDSFRKHAVFKFTYH